VQITNNIIQNLKSFRRGISLWDNSSGGAGDITATISGNEISAAAGYSGQFGIRLLGSITGTSISNNKISGVDKSFLGQSWSSGVPSGAVLHENSLLAAVYAIDWTDGAGLLNATCNWYGTNDGAIIATKILGSVTYEPWLNSGYDGSTSIGFQPAGTCSGTATDYDGDGVANESDCAPLDPTVSSPQTYYIDADGDSYGAGSVVMLCSSTAPSGYSTNNTDCNDADANKHASYPFYVDGDGDGVGAGSLVNVCAVSATTPPSGYSLTGTDCNDADATVTAPQTYYVDADGDGYGDPKTATQICSSTPPTGYVANKLDCNDKNPKSGICPPAPTPQPCGNGTTVMCKDGVQECVKNKDVKQYQKDGWKLGPCTSGQRLITVGNTEQAVDIAIARSTPLAYGLANYPNPFSALTTIRYQLPVDSKVSLKVYNSLGQAIATLVEEDKKAGSYNVRFNASKFAQGLYTCKLVATSGSKHTVQSIKLVVAK
jgi:hypothetical protein